MRQRKARDRSLATLLAGIALLLPPIALLFDVRGTLFGLPATLLYLFFVWAALIVMARLLAPKLRGPDRP
mgnify:CR=1 FL=1